MWISSEDTILKSRLGFLIVAALMLFVLTACQEQRSSAVMGAHANCNSPDNLNSVSGSAHCFAIKTYIFPGGSKDTLVVVLHGDLSRGGEANYIIPVALSAASHGAIGIAMARPGYTLDGRTSSGDPTRDMSRDEKFTAYEINSIASAVASLKKHHRSKRVVMVGHSGGAIISGVILGSSAPLVDAAVLVSCPCDLHGWRYSHNWSPLENAESPLGYLSYVPKSSKIFALTGELDENTYPQNAKDYVKEARGMGIDAKFLLVEHAGHNFDEIGENDKFKESLRQAIGASN